VVKDLFGMAIWIASSSMLFQWLRAEYNTLVDVLEPVIDVKMKEKLANVLVAIFHKEGLIQNFLTDILVTEINKLGKRCIVCILF